MCPWDLTGTGLQSSAVHSLQSTQQPSTSGPLAASLRRSCSASLCFPGGMWCTSWSSSQTCWAHPPLRSLQRQASSAKLALFLSHVCRLLRPHCQYKSRGSLSYRHAQHCRHVLSAVKGKYLQMERVSEKMHFAGALTWSWCMVLSSSLCRSGMRRRGAS